MAQNNLLDIIVEKTSNTEGYTNAATIKENLSEIVKTMSKREKIVRESTIMLKLSGTITSEKITQLIEDSYCSQNSKASASYWFDKEHVYAQFISQAAKEQFLDWIQNNSRATDIRDAILPPNDNGEHLTRKPIRVIINNVRRNIKADIVEQSFKRILVDTSNSLQNFREGKPNAITGTRAIMFNTDSEGFKQIFGTLEGAIPYVSTIHNVKTKLYPKVNCKPWACNNCYEFGKHECKGKTCAKCGTTGHLTKDCENATKYCNNCKRRGHRAKDAHCPTYLGEVSKELRKVCIPMEYFTEKDLRFHFIKHHLQYS